MPCLWYRIDNLTGREQNRQRTKRTENKADREQGKRKTCTAANVRSAFTKGNGNIGTPGCVSFMFDKKGQIIIDKEECDMEADDLMMTALDAGAEDFSEEEDSFEILTDPDTFEEVREALEKATPRNWSRSRR